MPESDRTASNATGPGILSRTAAALAVAADRRDSRLVALAAGGGYLLLYLVTVGDLAVGGWTESVTVRTAADLSRAVVSVGFFRFDAVAAVSAGPVTYLFSPLNVVVATTLSALVGANLALTYLGFVQPRACGLEASTGVVAGVPALLSGAACCGPTILLVVGIQASATLITGFQLLVPLAVAMLVGSLLLIGRQVDPDLL